MRYPEFLPPGGTIGFIAPAFGCTIEPYKSCMENSMLSFRRQGYHIDMGENCVRDCGIGISNTPEACGREIMEYYGSLRNDVLLSVGGGEQMCEDLEYVDVNVLRELPPKWFMGYSDNTNLSFLLVTACDTAAIYGPNAPAFGMRRWHPCLQDAMNLLAGSNWRVRGYDRYEREGLKSPQNPLEPYHVTEPVVRKVYLPKDYRFSYRQDMTEAAVTAVSERLADQTRDLADIPALQLEGRLIGGCLDCLVNLLGTRFDHVASFQERYADDGVIWFLEACDLTVLGIRRALWQMKNAGWFRNVKGFLVGRPYNHGQVIMGLDQYRAVTDMLKEFDVPILMDLDIGHIPPMMPLVLGSMAKVTTEGNDITIEMRAEE